MLPIETINQETSEKYIYSSWDINPEHPPTGRLLTDSAHLLTHYNLIKTTPLYTSKKESCNFYLNPVGGN